MACGESDPSAEPASDGGAADASDDADGGDADAGGQDASDSVYDRDHVLDVQLTIAAGDWDSIRMEGRSLDDVFSGCDDPSFAYTVVPASVEIDGERHAQVGVRKKGFVGSLSAVRPSLRIDFAFVDAEARFHGLKGLTLNNNRQDESQTRQCMAYALFAAAGVPAPRCSFARVTVNGEELGIYTNVEQVGKPFLARSFDSDDGNLYEGNAGADFREGFLDNLEKKTHEDDPDRSELQALADALEEEEDAGLERVEALIDLDAFYRFWAVESLISHWDGYTGDLNNFFVYLDPSTDKLVFLPWGTDGSFDKDHGFLPELGRPFSVLALARLPRRLYSWPTSREAYRATMRELLDTVWAEDDLLAEVDRIADLVGPSAQPVALEAQREFIRTRRAEIEGELEGAAPPWPFAERPARACRPSEVMEVTATFDVKWGSLDTVAVSADNTLHVPIDGSVQSFSSMLGSAGPYEDDASLNGPSIRMLAPGEGGVVTVVQFTIGPRPLEPGSYPLHGVETSGFVGRGTGMADLDVLGFFSDGEITIERGSMEDGATVRGSLTAHLVPVEIQ